MEPGGMQPQEISVSRALPIDGALLSEVLLRLRRDAGAGVVHWTLGERGSVEVDANFTTQGRAWCAPARVWDHGGRAVAGMTVHIESTAPDTVTVTLSASSALTPWWQQRAAQLVDLGEAAVDELGEEMLWHASRAGVASHR